MGHDGTTEQQVTEGREHITSIDNCTGIHDSAEDFYCTCGSYGGISGAGISGGGGDEVGYSDCGAQGSRGTTHTGCDIGSCIGVIAATNGAYYSLAGNREAINQLPSRSFSRGGC